MYVRKAHKIWIEQCDAAQTIKARFGLTAAFDYLVGEKLMSFASAASRHPDFARELSRFVSEVRRMFTPDDRLTRLQPALHGFGGGRPTYAFNLSHCATARNLGSFCQNGAGDAV